MLNESAVVLTPLLVTCTGSSNRYPVVVCLSTLTGVVVPKPTFKSGSIVKTTLSPTFKSWAVDNATVVLNWSILPVSWV